MRLLFSSTPRHNSDDTDHIYSTKAFFGDLKDGVHHGDENDPRVSVIEVVPKEIQYWISTESGVKTAITTTIDAALGKTSVPGELRTISEPEASASVDLIFDFVLMYTCRSV